VESEDGRGEVQGSLASIMAYHITFSFISESEAAKDWYAKEDLVSNWQFFHTFSLTNSGASL
jgi:hypothetical protein